MKIPFSIPVIDQDVHEYVGVFASLKKTWRSP